MPRRSLRCVVEIGVHALTCPGVYLPRRDDVYLSVCLFGQVRRTQLTAAVFPLIFGDKFKFDKACYTAYHPTQVADSLEDEPVIIELIQLSDIYEGGKLLASYETSARDFLYPYPSYSPTYGTQDREILLERSLDFPGISPRLEFSTQTIISELNSTVLTPSDIDDDIIYVPKTGRRSRSRTRTPKKTKSISYGRPTVSSISRCRSLSPSMRRKFDALNIEDDVDRPPFVVRKVQSRKLIGRDPGTPSPKQKIRCMHGTYTDNNTSKKKRTTPHCFDDDVIIYYGICKVCGLSLTERNCTLCQAFHRYTGKSYWGHNDNRHPHNHDTSIHVVANRSNTSTPRKSSSCCKSVSWDLSKIGSDDSDSDLLDLTTTRYRTPSPVYRSYSPTFTSRYLDRSYSPVRAELIKSEVERSIERNRATRERLDRLDRLYPYSSYREDMDLGAEYWRNKWKEYQTNKHYRDEFYKDIEKIYKEMYETLTKARRNTLM